MAVNKWIVVADERTARLVSLERVPRGRWRGRERSSLESRWEDYHEHQRPSALGGRSAPAHEHLSPGFSEAEAHEERRRFARDVLEWIEQGRRSIVPDDEQPVTVFAAPGFFGVLREELERGDRHRPQVHELELTRLRPEDLAEHPAVRRALGIEEHSSTA